MDETKLGDGCALKDDDASEQLPTDSEKSTEAGQGGQKVRPWVVSSWREVYTSRVLSLREQEASSTISQKQTVFNVLHCPGWVNIIALTPEKEVPLVRQYRAGSDAVSLEIPGGMMDPGDGDPKEAALRELVEETGYTGNSAREIGRIRPNPALQDNICYTYLVEDAYRIGDPVPDTHEEISVELCPLSEIPKLIGSGAIDHSLVVVAFVWLLGLRQDAF